jgi:hypothetical protein
VVDGADGAVSLAARLESQMGAPFSGGLEDHGLFIIGIDDAVCQDTRRIDDKDIQMQAASSAAQAEHDPVYGEAAYLAYARKCFDAHQQ